MNLWFIEWFQLLKDRQDAVKKSETLKMNIKKFFCDFQHWLQKFLTENRLNKLLNTFLQQKCLNHLTVINIKNLLLKVVMFILLTEHWAIKCCCVLQNDLRVMYDDMNIWVWQKFCEDKFFFDDNTFKNECFC